MKNKQFIIILLVGILICLGAYFFLLNQNTNQQDVLLQDNNAFFEILDQSTPNTIGNVGMANPASVNCSKIGGVLSLQTDKDGNQIGVCTKNNKSCEEWALFRGECSM